MHLQGQTNVSAQINNNQPLTGGGFLCLKR